MTCTMKKMLRKHIQIQCSENIGRIYKDKKCGSRARTWLIGKLFIEFFDGFPGIGRILHRLPRYLERIVTHPIHQVLKFAVEISRIEDVFHLKLRKTIHLGRKRGGHDAIRERVGHMRFQEADMEHRMDVHGGG